MAVSVDICAATFRRPAQLVELLRSLACQKVGSEFAVRIIIVDNDAEGSGRDAVKAAEEGRFPVHYALEPRRGISYARNRCLELSDADWLAFIDDDETAAEDWLWRLVDAANRYHADIVVGPVLSRLPPGAPEWMGRIEWFDRKRFPTGTPIAEGGGTGNVLLSRAILNKARRGFDLAYNLTGGGDSEYFEYLRSIGATKVFCNEAEATETVPPERARIGWLLRRSFRGGQNWARLKWPRQSPAARAVWLLQYVLLTGLAAIGAAVLLPFGFRWSAQPLMRAASYCGQLSAPIGRWYQEYAVHAK